MPADETDTIPQFKKGELVKTSSGNFVIEKKLGEGGFGAVYRVSKDKLEYAMKVESSSDRYQVLKLEVKVLKALEQSKARHACDIVARGKNKPLNFNYVIMTLIGPSLEELKRKYGCNGGRRFSASTSLRVALQTLEGVEDLHKAGYLHRDLKPANYAIGRPEANEIKKIYILDFGLAREYRNRETGEIRLPRNVANFRGTPRYAALSSHKGIELSRFSDIETWLYMTIEYTSGQLPWRLLETKPEIGAAKEAARSGQARKDLLFDCPAEYDVIFKYLEECQYYEEPDYNFIYTKLRKAMRKHRPIITDEAAFDWEEVSEGGQ